MRISDWSSDVCSSDLAVQGTAFPLAWRQDRAPLDHERSRRARRRSRCESGAFHRRYGRDQAADAQPAAAVHDLDAATGDRTRVVQGKSVSVRVDLGGRGIIKKKNTDNTKEKKK